MGCEKTGELGDGRPERSGGVLGRQGQRCVSAVDLGVGYGEAYRRGQATDPAPQHP